MTVEAAAVEGERAPRDGGPMSRATRFNRSARPSRRPRPLAAALDGLMTVRSRWTGGLTI
jgi:hypothetical protein